MCESVRHCVSVLEGVLGGVLESVYVCVCVLEGV